MRKTDRQGAAKAIKWLRRGLRLHCANDKQAALTQWLLLPPYNVQQQMRGTREVLRINHDQLAYAFRRVFGVGLDSIERIWEQQ